VAIALLVALTVIGWSVAPVGPLPVAPRAAPAVDGPDVLTPASGPATNADND
jgi:hypothetical protein